MLPQHPLPPHPALPHQPDPQPLTFPLSHCPPLVPSQSNTRQQCRGRQAFGAAQSGAPAGGVLLGRVLHPPPTAAQRCRLSGVAGGASTPLSFWLAAAWAASTAASAYAARASAAR